MRIIYVHNDIDVSVNGYVNVYADGCASVLVDWYMYVSMDMTMIMIIVIVCVYMHELENENWFSYM